MAAPAFLGVSGRDDLSHKFRVNPNSVEWGYQQHQTSIDTVGGRVVQLLGISVKEMTVTGDAVHRRELKRLGQNVSDLMDFHIETERPVSLRVPSRNWLFKVYVRSFPEFGWDRQTLTYPYQLKLDVEEDLGVATEFILKGELRRLARNIGYDPKWHGGNIALFEEILGSSPETYLAGSQPSQRLQKNQLNMEEVAELVLWQWPPSNSAADPLEEPAIGVAIAWAESSGNTQVYNGICCYGLWQVNVGAHRPTATVAKARDVFWATKFARKLYDGRKNSQGFANRWDDWEVYTTGRYKFNMANARIAVNKVLEGKRAGKTGGQPGPTGPTGGAGGPQ